MIVNLGFYANAATLESMLTIRAGTSDNLAT